jgi:hypothetical protein
MVGDDQRFDGLSRGSALEPVDGRLIAQMTRMLIHDRCCHRTSWSNKISFISPIKLSNETLSFLL